MNYYSHKRMMWQTGEGFVCGYMDVERRKREREKGKKSDEGTKTITEEKLNERY